MTPLLAELTTIVRHASTLVQQVYEEGKFDVEFKAPNDPVTRADRLANTQICSCLSAGFPSVPIVAEESHPDSYADYRSHHRVFFVDPIDGTREFLQKNGEFCIMIGLIEGDRAVAGVIHSPTLGVTWGGQLGHGAFELDDSGQAKPIAVSLAADVSNFRVVVSRAAPNRREAAMFESVGAAEVRALGSAGLKGVAVATGAVDAYLAPTHAGMRWDACAIDALVTAAGGIFTDANGLALNYRDESLLNEHGIVASNASQHAHLLAALSPG